MLYCAWPMAWIEPVTLTGAHVVLEPAAERHHADLLAAGAGRPRLGLAAVGAPGAARPTSPR